MAQTTPEEEAAREFQIPFEETEREQEEFESAVFTRTQMGKSEKDSGQKANMDFILTVPLSVTVEIGRTKKKIRDILEFQAGTILPLDKPAGEAVDVLVNGTCIARGEVVVIDDYFGVRITEIHSDSLFQR